ncbi:MAG: tetratricopeptide repeat protein [Treponema sp.]|jgi:tetratricopeptide (TPR) repeat protein|nr:tetratricopeptide repeat protein [Treponema sp.]
MGFNDKNSLSGSRGGTAEAVSFSASLIDQGRYAEAFKLLASLRSAENSLPPELRPSLYFNLALCLMAAEQHTKAAAELEKALEAIKHLASAGGVRPAGAGFGAVPDSGPLPSAAPALPPEHTEVWQKLRSAELAGAVRPFRPDYPGNFPREAREDITVALIGAYERCGLEEKAKTLRSALTGPEFEEYKRQRVKSLLNEIQR